MSDLFACCCCCVTAHHPLEAASIAMNNNNNPAHRLSLQPPCRGLNYILHVVACITHYAKHLSAK